MSLCCVPSWAQLTQGQHMVGGRLGPGVTTAQQDIHIYKCGVKYDNKATDTSLAWFAGAGLEFDLGSRGRSMGLETR